MVDLKGVRLDVAGGGVFGLAVALVAVRRGADVRLYEPREDGGNASEVAAGMLAPAFEAALDPLSAGHFGLFRAARERWPEFADQLGGAFLERSGATRVATAAEARLIEPLFQSLAAMGAAVERLTTYETRRLHPLLSADIAGAVYTSEDWRIDPIVALRAMARAFEHAGGRIVKRAFAFGRTDYTPDAIVLATGAQSGQWRKQASALSWLKPIKGQILQFEAGPRGGPMVRGASGYIVPQVRGAMVGASMEVGVDNAIIDPSVLQGLRSGAAELFPHVAEAPAQGFAAVRAATPDGLPLVGEVRAEGGTRPRLFLAMGARRNGWLLAPMVGETVAMLLAGERVDAFGTLLNPQRFAAASASFGPRTVVPAE